MFYGEIKKFDIADGEGVRVSVFVRTKFWKPWTSLLSKAFQSLAASLLRLKTKPTFWT